MEPATAVRLPGAPRSSFGLVQVSTFARPRVVRGASAVLGLRPLLVRLAAATCQAGAMDDLHFFLELPQSRRKEACVVLFHGEGELPAAAVMLFQYRLLGVGCRIYSTADISGRRTVIAPAAERAQYAAAAARVLLKAGAQIVLTSLQQPGEPAAAMREVRDGIGAMAGARWAATYREVPAYLPLLSTLDETLARIGQRTRSNLRYYRRRAERDLGCRFVQDVQMPLEEFLSFNRRCKYAVSDELARWRYRSLQLLQQPFLHGIADGEGNWLALVCGRHHGGYVEIDWQANRDDLPSYSLSTVIRSYLMELAIEQGATRFYIEGGTPNPIQQSFVTENVLDLTVVRRTLYTRAIRRLLPRDQFPKNHLSQVIADRQLQWHRA